ncbi:polysaccharide deacetylase [Gordoniibacillus kamchatkensis]|uniref:Polysaccharide deacetylase n=1 Tax=Gordoniibacillus kamchatkensis TaxID=1590651 RepID=A0ABR5AFA4_9BACL|nr:polysaccharide deacetylase family sporulation protein PdaB [Paenibacillus sp. VKM B-2647]KIL39734.1 polysaccharide deacetylase [Paenibacillus sp. VKM B-2647]
MNVFLVVNGKRIKQFIFIAAAVMFAAGIIYSEQTNVSAFASEQPAAVFSVPTDKKILALTFDISWGEKRTEPIIKVLEDKKVKNATFFLSSPWAKAHPEVVGRIVKDGYEIGSHGHKFTNYSELEEADIRKQILTAHQLLSEATGKSPTLIRLPNGDFDKRVLTIADSLGYTVIQWDTDSYDWKDIGADSIVKRVVTRAHPGDIILLHASDSSVQTAAALPQIIDQLRAKGYEFVSVSELLQQTQVNNKPVEDQTFKPLS